MADDTASDPEARTDDCRCSESRAPPPTTLDLTVRVRPATGTETDLPESVQPSTEMDDFARIEERVLAWLDETPDNRALFALDHSRALASAAPEAPHSALDAIERARRERDRTTFEHGGAIDLASISVELATEGR